MHCLAAVNYYDTILELEFLAAIDCFVNPIHCNTQMTTVYLGSYIFDAVTQAVSLNISYIIY